MAAVIPSPGDPYANCSVIVEEPVKDFALRQVKQFKKKTKQAYKFESIENSLDAQHVQYDPARNNSKYTQLIFPAGTCFQNDVFSSDTTVLKEMVPIGVKADKMSGSPVDFAAVTVYFLIDKKGVHCVVSAKPTATAKDLNFFESLSWLQNQIVCEKRKRRKRDQEDQIKEVNRN